MVVAGNPGLYQPVELFLAEYAWEAHSRWSGFCAFPGRCPGLSQNPYRSGPGRKLPGKNGWRRHLGRLGHFHNFFFGQKAVFFTVRMMQAAWAQYLQFSPQRPLRALMIVQKSTWLPSEMLLQASSFPLHGLPGAGSAFPCTMASSFCRRYPASIRSATAVSVSFIELVIPSPMVYESL